MSTDSTYNSKPDPTDASLMSKVVDGNETAFEMLVRRHEDAVFRLANRILNGNKAEARDVAQEVFIKLWQKPSAWKPTARFTTWLYRVTTNRALNQLRSARLKSFFSMSDYTSDYFPSTDEMPDRRMTREEDEINFETMFNRLPPRQKAALHLRYREDMSVSEIAEALGVSYKSVESLIFRGKKTLRKAKLNE